MQDGVPVTFTGATTTMSVSDKDQVRWRIKEVHNHYMITVLGCG